MTAAAERRQSSHNHPPTDRRFAHSGSPLFEFVNRIEDWKERKDCNAARLRPQTPSAPTRPMQQRREFGAPEGSRLTQLVFLRGEKALGFESGHAAGAGGGDGLAIAVILNVAGGEDAFDAGLCAIMRDEVAGF